MLINKLYNLIVHLRRIIINEEVIREAKKETQFSKALSSVKEAVPQTLLINGRNPLTLLQNYNPFQ